MTTTTVQLSIDHKIVPFMQQFYERFCFIGCNIKSEMKNGKVKKIISYQRNYNLTTIDTWLKDMKEYGDWCKSASIKTGSISNITVLDFDTNEAYNTFCENVHDFKSYFTVKTLKGYHVYCNYDKRFKNTTEVCENIKAIDVRNDGGVIVCPYSSYKLPDGSLFTYEFIGGEILDIPQFFIDNIKTSALQVERVIEYDVDRDELTPMNYENELTDEDNNRLLYHLENISPSILASYTDWFKIGQSIKNLFGENWLVIFKHHSLRSVNPDHKYPDYDEWVKFFKDDPLCGRTTIVNYSRQSNSGECCKIEDEYYENIGKKRAREHEEILKIGRPVIQSIIKDMKEESEIVPTINLTPGVCLINLTQVQQDTKHKEEKTKAINTDALMAIFKSGDNNVAKYIADFLKDKVVYYGGLWWIFDTKLKLWRPAEPHGIVVSEIQRHININIHALYGKIILEEDDDKKKMLKKNVDAYSDLVYAVASGARSNNLVKYLKDCLYDHEFGIKLDVYPYKIAYQNGMLDLKTLEFTEGLKPSDYLTKYIPFDYKPGTPKDIATVREEFKKICNYKDDHLEYYLSLLGYVMTGDATRLQNFWLLLGQTASNGKSIPFEALMEICPNLVKKGQNDLFDMSFGSRHKEMASWRGLRLLWINEATDKAKDSEALKLVGDGGKMEYKVMMGTTADVRVTFKLLFVSNSSLNMKADSGITRRFKSLQMDSEFSVNNKVDDVINKKFKADLTFGKKLETIYRDAFMSLIFQYSKKFVDDEYALKPYPSDWQESTTQIVDDNNLFVSFFFQNFFIPPPHPKVDNASDVVVDDDNKVCISKEDVEFILKDFKGKINFKDELKRMKLNITYDSQLRKKNQLGKWTKGFFVGLRERREDDPA
jgi:phage/plasmid-associated DNA primase